VRARDTIELRALQALVAVACLVPLVTGAQGVWRGAAMLKGVPVPVPVDLDSHFRYLTGIFLAVGVAFASCVPGLEHKGPRFRLLGAMVVVGGLSRLDSLLTVGLPSVGHRFGLVMELGVVPLLMLWQWRLEKRQRGSRVR
jgi:hypothetical protein